MAGSGALATRCWRILSWTRSAWADGAGGGAGEPLPRERCRGGLACAVRTVRRPRGAGGRPERDGGPAMKGQPLSPVKHATVNEALAPRRARSTGSPSWTPRSRRRRVPFARGVRGRARKRRPRALSTLGVRPGDRVALLLPTSPGFMDAFFGTLLAGAVPVPLYPPVRLGRLDEYHRSTARMLDRGERPGGADGWTRAPAAGQAAERARPPLGCRIGRRRPPGDGARGGHLPVSARVARAHPVLLGLHGGSEAGGADARHLMAQCAALQSLLPDGGPKPRWACPGCRCTTTWGSSAVCCRPVYYPGNAGAHPARGLPRPAGAVAARLSRHRAIISPAPNFAYGLCLKRVKDAELDGRGSLRLAARAQRRGAGVAGDAAPLHRALRALRASSRGRCGPCTACREASLAVTFPPAAGPACAAAWTRAVLARGAARGGGLARAGVRGAPVPGVEVADARRAGPRGCRSGSVGRIFARGPSVMQGYFGNPEATAQR